MFPIHADQSAHAVFEAYLLSCLELGEGGLAGEELQRQDSHTPRVHGLCYLNLLATCISY